MDIQNSQYIVTGKQWDYEELRSIIYSLKEKYPFATYSICGRSWAGRGIFCLELGESENPVLYVGGFNGQEWMTTLVLLRFFECMCNAVSEDVELSSINIKKILKEQSIIILPCVNPDGVQIALHGAIGAGCYSGFAQRISQGDHSRWNANARGVDISHNFDADWHIMRKIGQESGIHSPSPNFFGGQTYESEPETQAITRLCRDKNIRHALAMHSGENKIAWEHGEKTPECSQIMAKIFALSSNHSLSMNSNEKGGGFRNWFIKEFERPAFSVETDIKNTSFEELYNNLEEMLIFTALM